MRGRTVHGVAGGHHLVAGAQHVLDGARGARLELVHAEDRSDGHPGVQVRRPVDRVAADGVVARVALEDDQVLLLLAHQHLHVPGALHRVDEDLVADHVQLLLVVPGRVGLPVETNQVHQLRSSDCVRDELERILQRVEQERQLPCRLGRQPLLLLDDEAGQRDQVGVNWGLGVGHSCVCACGCIRGCLCLSSGLSI